LSLDRLTAHYLDETHLAFRAVCDRFATDEIAPWATEWEEAGMFPRELYKKAADAGLMGPHFSEEYGGGGGDQFHGIMAGEGLLRGGSTGVLVGLGSMNIAVPPIMALGTEEQKQRFLPPIFSGDHISALAITEPGTGSDVSAVRTRAEKDGSDYLITGNKMFITSGMRAETVVVLARTSDDPHGGLTFFVVEKGMPGYEPSRAMKKTGWWASDTAELSFDRVRVPAANRLGAEGSGFMALMKNFETERLMLAVNGYSLAELAWDESVRYTRERAAFGRPIGKFQVIRHKLAAMAEQITAAKVLTYAVAHRMQAGDHIPGEVAMAKNVASDCARNVCWEAVQIFGGMGYMRETLVERLARDARLLPIGGGTQEIMREISARMMGFA
jgi:acyl-CoA dehydrogenase